MIHPKFLMNSTCCIITLKSIWWLSTQLVPNSTRILQYINHWGKPHESSTKFSTIQNFTNAILEAYHTISIGGLFKNHNILKVLICVCGSLRSSNSCKINLNTDNVLVEIPIHTYLVPDMALNIMHQSMCSPTPAPAGRPRGFWQK